MLRHLELIDDEAAEYEVKMVKIDDPLMAKKYGHREPPGLGYFRKGNYIKYEGDEFDEEEMLDWLTDPNVMAVSDQIEKVNRKMFEKIKSRNDNLAVFFFAEKDCKQCPPVLQELENIDDEAEAAGNLFIEEFLHFKACFFASVRHSHCQIGRQSFSQRSWCFCSAFRRLLQGQFRPNNLCWRSEK